MAVWLLGTCEINQWIQRHTSFRQTPIYKNTPRPRKKYLDRFYPWMRNNASRQKINVVIIPLRFRFHFGMVPNPVRFNIFSSGWSPFPSWDGRNTGHQRSLAKSIIQNGNHIWLLNYLCHIGIIASNITHLRCQCSHKILSTEQWEISRILQGHKCLAIFWGYTP